ncbi:hypothetical protein [Nocardioides gilvus]|uniref:hypothetical protein n=1 Tax=Nocardioides gilvus TaxID=1735589 RepID=UPI000D750B11|nr:hypothetical protein [Nocardioides gilvus]
MATRTIDNRTEVGAPVAAVWESRPTTLLAVSASTGGSLAACRTVVDGDGLDGPATILFIVTPGHLDAFFRAKDLAPDPGEVAALVHRFF